MAHRNTQAKSQPLVTPTPNQYRHETLKALVSVSHTLASSSDKMALMETGRLEGGHDPYDNYDHWVLQQVQADLERRQR